MQWMIRPRLQWGNQFEKLNKLIKYLSEALCCCITWLSGTLRLEKAKCLIVRYVRESGKDVNTLDARVLARKYINVNVEESSGKYNHHDDAQ